MARSKYIYVVMLEHEVVGAFTVKREMVSRVSRVAGNWPALAAVYHVYRHEDNAVIGATEPAYLGTGAEVCGA